MATGERPGSAGKDSQKKLKVKTKSVNRSQSNLEELDQSSRCEKCLDYLITGDFGGLYRGCVTGFKNCLWNLWERQKNFQKWFADKRKEQEARAMDFDMPHPFPRIRTIVNSTSFEAWGNFVIFCNTFVVGWQAENLLPKNTTPEKEQISFIFEQVFTSAFVIELTLSTLCWGWTSLCARENWLDVFLVFLGVLTTWVFGLFGLQIDFLRKLTALRTLRLVRLARAVRLRPEFSEMWFLMKGLIECGETLVWTYVMIGCVLYFFAIIATAMIGKVDMFLSDADAGPIAEEYFKDVPHSMLSLFQLMTLDSWTGFARPLIWPSDGSAHWWVAGFFVLFIAVGVFVMLNLVTAVVVETGFSDSKSEEKELAIRMEREKEEELEDLKQFFLQIDLDGSGSLTKQEFFKATKQRKIRNKLRALDIMPKDIDELWDILDDGQGELEVEAFQSGIRKLRGEAKSKDILKLSKELRQFEMSVDEVEGFIESSKHRLKSVNHQLTRCRGDIAAFTRTLVRAKEAVKMAAQTQNMS